MDHLFEISDLLGRETALCNTLWLLKDAVQRTFFNILKGRGEKILSYPPLVAVDLSPPPAVREGVPLLLDLIDTYNSMMVPASVKKPDFDPVITALLDPIFRVHHSVFSHSCTFLQIIKCCLEVSIVVHKLIRICDNYGNMKFVLQAKTKGSESKVSLLDGDLQAFPDNRREVMSDKCSNRSSRGGRREELGLPKVLSDIHTESQSQNVQKLKQWIYEGRPTSENDEDDDAYKPCTTLRKRIAKCSTDQIDVKEADK
ncbi:hypothetical protein OPV22_014985 [Ensete ventricosum]|uniref:Conserved Oligomeric Golgi complex subunit 6 C-terminal domain-containing protein n=1 Tax=Ensete ventricosum TaxID=4639 RepID=A0AAV8PRI9_ENSVE|nr:hypothetical protein OPV22_014985 [Ensete ventricosum]